MADTYRSWVCAVLMVSFVGLQTTSALCASESESSSRETAASPSPGDSTPTTSTDEPTVAPEVSSAPLPPMTYSRFTLPESFVENPSSGGIANGARRPFTVTSTRSRAFAGQIYQGRPYRMNRDGSIAALMLGAAAAIGGTALLVYANRPECTMNQFAGGCGYGTKVIGGAVLSTGIVGLFIGALTWR